MVQEQLTVWGIGTPRTLRVHWALHELDRAYDTEPVITRTAMMDEPRFLAVSPGKKIPALQHGDLTLTESAAICRYLMNTFSDRNWSTREQAQMDRLIHFVLMEIDATALYVVRRHEGLPEIYGEAPAAITCAYDYADRQFAVLADFIGTNTYALGEEFSEADIHIGSILDWARFLDVDVPRNLIGYHDRLRERPAYTSASKLNASPMQ